ncbi:MAG TPA: hypothetical protein VF462_07230 [Micromonosporaceae bacterium]
MSGVVDPASAEPAQGASPVSEVSQLQVDLLRWGAVGATAFAGVLHYAVVPQHRPWWLAALAFTLVGGMQLAWAVLAFVARDRRLLLLGAALNGAALLAWLVSRTAGLPFGPHSGSPEPAGALDLVTVVTEAAAVAALIGIATVHTRRQPVPA